MTLGVSEGRRNSVWWAATASPTAHINTELSLSRHAQVYRIAQQLDIFRLLSFYYSSVGFYLNQVGSFFCNLLF